MYMMLMVCCVSDWDEEEGVVDSTCRPPAPESDQE